MSDTQGVSVRRAGVDDLDDLVGLFSRYRSFYRRETDMNAALDFLRARLAGNESIVLLATRAESAGGSPIGFAQLYPTFSSLGMGRVLVLNDLFVDSSARTHGVGRLLVEQVKRLAEEQGAVRVTLETEVTNSIARRLYESSGFTRVEDFDRYAYTPDGGRPAAGAATNGG
jgi:ribosomal protein S18 acetylase RimI-like enzyme